jgi:hypothetical protein
LDAENWHRAFAALGRDRLLGADEELARSLATTTRTVRRRFAQWLAGGKDPLAVANRSLSPTRAEVLPEAFVEWWRALVESHHRSTRAAYRDFGRRWRRGDDIPGLDPQAPRHELPKGCSLGNLYRFQPGKFELVAARRGLGAAKAEAGPKVFTTRADLWPGSHYLFDDMWHDNFVVHAGQLVRVLEFDALDLYSANKFAWGCQPRLRSEEGTMGNLKESQMRFLLALILWRDGYSPRGTELVVEHGTAAIRDALEALLHDRTGGLVRVRRSGFTGREQALVGDWQGDGGGNPRHKAALESLRSLIHAELGAIPAQTGKDRDHRPEGTAGVLRYSSKLLSVAATLPAHRLELLKFPLLEYHGQFMPLLGDVYRAINSRTDHELEGWAEAGHMVIEYRLLADSPDWIGPQRLLGMGPMEQAFLVERAKVDARCLRQRRLSPEEAWRRRRQTDLVRIPDFVVSEILGPDMAREVSVRGSYIEFQDQDLAPAELRYESRIRDPEGKERELPQDTYLAFVNPFCLDQLFIQDARGRHLGIARRDVRVSRMDDRALHSRLARVKEREKDLLTPQRARQVQKSRDAVELREHNAAVIQGQKDEVTDLEASADRALRDLY